MDKHQALYAFWSSFGIPAYDDTHVPDKSVVFANGNNAYLTYNDVTASLDEPVPLYANLWYKEWEWTEIDAKAKEIAESIGRSGKIVPFDGGYIWICRGVPFSQRLPDDDDTIRRIYINVMAEYLSAD